MVSKSKSFSFQSVRLLLLCVDVRPKEWSGAKLKWLPGDVILYSISNQGNCVGKDYEV